MKLQIEILESNSQIQNMILSSIRDHINAVFSKALASLQKLIPIEVERTIMTEPEYQSLIGGTLMYEFGIPNASQKINNIINIWSNNIIVDSLPISINGTNIVGGFSINMIKDDFSDVLGSDSAVVVDDSSGLQLPWLEWLLFYGGKIIIKNHEVKIGPNPRSRTGMAIMKPSQQNWRVPPEFAGTRENNWITRALDKIDESIPLLIQKEIEKNI